MSNIREVDQAGVQIRWGEERGSAAVKVVKNEEFQPTKDVMKGTMG